MWKLNIVIILVFLSFACFYKSTPNYRGIPLEDIKRHICFNLSQSVNGTLYESESDYSWEVFSVPGNGPLNKNSFSIYYLGCDPRLVEEIDYNEFITLSIKLDPKYKDIKRALNNNLQNIKVFKMSSVIWSYKTEKFFRGNAVYSTDMNKATFIVYVIGESLKIHEWIGIKTISIET